MGELRPARVEGHAHDLRQLAGSQGLPPSAGLDRQGGRRNVDPLGRRVAPLAGARVQGRLDLRPYPRRQSPRLAADARRARALLRQGRGQDGRDPHERLAGTAGQQQFQGLQGWGRQARLQGVPHRPDGDQFRRARRPQFLPADRILFPGLQVGREMVDALHRDSEGRGDRQHGGSPGVRMSRRSSTTPRARSRA